MSETRFTDWTPFGAFNISQYRVGLKLENGTWAKRHDWKYDDGRIEVGSWCPTSLASFPEGF